MDILRQFAETAPVVEAQNEGILNVLGIDWMMLTFQIAAFLVTVFLLGKFVFPWLMKSVDERQENLDAISKAAADAQTASADSEARLAKIMDRAKVEAGEIVANAKSESAALLSAAEEKSRKRADQIVADAKTQIDKDILAAKKALHNETIELVALATEKILGKAVTSDVDNGLIADAIKGVKQ
jgi:F-type H+-transporting ATPase subunit b